MTDYVTNNIRVIDIESSIKNRGDNAIGNFKASPHCPQNEVVWFGALNPKDGSSATHRTHGPMNIVPSPTVLVGQNIKFDLLYMMRNGTFRDECLPKIRIWDTMHVEYLLTGQQDKMISLDKLVAKYGGTVKDDRLKEFWDNDVDTEDIDDSIIEPYLIEDLRNTSIVFLAQVELVKQRNMMPLVKSQMDAILATAEMEFNGMYFDKPSAVDKATELMSERIRLKDAIETDMHIMCPRLPNPNVASPIHISFALFGGELEISTKEPMYNEDGSAKVWKTGSKAGQQRYKSVKTVLKHDGKLTADEYTTETKRKGVYVVNDEVLSAIADERLMIISSFCTKILRYRALSKDIETYYVGYSALVWPHDSCIHPNYNHSLVVTGRLSHSAPNLGNVSHDKGD